MKKKMKMISFLLILILCLGMTIPAYAEDSEGFADEYYRVQDQADLMTDSEESELLDVLDEISIRQKMDVIVMTTDTLEGLTVEEFADDMYDYCEYGYGADKDGVLLLISTEDNDVYISTCGYGITAFTDAGIKYIPKQMMDDLKSQDYFSACMTFAELCDDFITQARNGSPYTARTLPKDALPFYWIFISIGDFGIHYCWKNEGTVEDRSLPGGSRKLCERWKYECHRKQRFVLVPYGNKDCKRKEFFRQQHPHIIFW